MPEALMTPAALTAATAMIDSRRWGVAKDVINLVRLNTLDIGERGYVLLAREHVADYLGVSNWHVHEVLKNLVKGRVLLRIPGRGSRASAYRINPDLAEWRMVDEKGRLAELPWRRHVGAELARRRVDDVAERRSER